MAVSGKIYDIALAKMGTGEMYWDTAGDDFKLVLMSSAYTFDSAHETYADLTNEISDTGNYTAGGLALTTGGTTYADGVLYYTANDVSITAATCTFRKLAIYNDSVENNLLLYIDLGEDITLSNETFLFHWNEEAIWYGVMGGGTP